MKELLHLVFGGELVDPRGRKFKDVNAIDIGGLYPNHASAHDACKAKAEATVDDAHRRYFLDHIHRLDDAEFGEKPNADDN